MIEKKKSNGIMITNPDSDESEQDEKDVDHRSQGMATVSLDSDEEEKKI